MKSNVLIAVWLIVVGVLAFIAVSVILDDPGTAPPDSGDNGVTPIDVPDQNDPNANGGEGGRRPGVRTDNPRVRKTPKIIGQVFGVDGEPAADVRVVVSNLVERTRPQNTMKLPDIRLIAAVLPLDIEEWDQPRPMDDWLQLARDSQNAAQGAPEIASGATDDEGNFEIEISRGYGGGPFRVSARSGSDRASATGVMVSQSIELTLGPADVVTGVVLGGQSNAGVPQATVVLDDGERTWVVETNDQGDFKLEGVPPGGFNVSVGAEGHPPILAQFVQVTAGTPLSLRLPRGTDVNVSCVLENDEDDTMAPIPGVECVALEETTFMYRKATSDANGVASFKGLPPGTYLINGRKYGVIPWAEEMLSLADQQQAVDVELAFEPAVMTPIRIIDETGAPVAGVRFYSANADDEYDAMRSDALSGETNANGTFEFPFEFDGPRALIYGFKAGYGMMVIEPEGANDDGDPIEIIARKGIRVRGTVRTPDGKPIPDALVWIEVTPDDLDSWLDDVIAQVRAGPNGEFDFPYVPQGEIILSAELGDDGWSDDYEIERIADTWEYRQDIELELE